MRFAWNEKKNKINKAKHGLDFELAKRVFEDPCLLSWLDSRFHNYDEERYIGIGCIDNLLVVVVIHTFRSSGDEQEITHIISARKANKKECATYFRYQKKAEINCEYDR